MNLLHMKYALAVAETNSINKAAEELLVGAPALSRAIKELESGLGVSLFERSAKGMFLTHDGELFVRYARNALKKVDDIEALFKNGSVSRKHFSLSVSGSGYTTCAFTSFTKQIDRLSETDIFYNEAGNTKVLKGVLENEYRLGILRYKSEYDNYYKSLLTEKGLSCELITEFSYTVVVNKESPLAKLSAVTTSDLKNYVEIVSSVSDVLSSPGPEEDKAKAREASNCRIYLSESGIPFDILSLNSDTYMWMSPIPSDLLEQYNLVKIQTGSNKPVCKDILIHKSDYRLSELDKIFIDELIRTKRKCFAQ